MEYTRPSHTSFDRGGSGFRMSRIVAPCGRNEGFSKRKGKEISEEWWRKTKGGREEGAAIVFGGLPRRSDVVFALLKAHVLE